MGVSPPAYDWRMAFPSFAGLAAGWRGETLFQFPAWSMSFSRAELDELEACSAASRQASEARPAVKGCPLPTLQRRLASVRDVLETGPGVVRLRGLPVARWGALQAEQAFWALAVQLGTPVSQGPGGERLFHVRDHGYTSDDPRFRGPASRRRLSFHTDRCDVIAFACLQPAQSGGESFVVSSVTLHEELRISQPDVLEVLSQPFPFLRHTVDTGNAKPYCELPIFSVHDGHFAGHFLRVLIDRADQAADAPSLSTVQRRALDVLESLAEDPALHVRFRLEPGDVLLLNNWTTFHRRSEFTDADTLSARRHLLRIWLSMPNSRPLAPCFRDHFGDTAAGALRGGMCRGT